MELPEEIVKFSEWFTSAKDDFQKMDKLAYCVGIERKLGETNEQLVERILKQIDNPYNLGGTK